MGAPEQVIEEPVNETLISVFFKGPGLGQKHILVVSIELPNFILSKPEFVINGYYFLCQIAQMFYRFLVVKFLL